ncbi:MAG: hypothetical protein JRG67_07375 [Deltaproteobacteria bacterium]|jgi:hypothetical protein|nr:hypothetical protein [Deltaproteobacteria bacterium]MBW1875083.1 hypothetical protein [Deltaproteobacteria bacterium]MBW2210855.1 hypothetical protein [Deltaproteobacteria bacterium]MBW2213770.1 hypothetical protein [Deltaproteobacteria bacterium]MBW2379260.1 hypothetical protein [Deltaproteobacteria bacterium]
MLRARIAAWLRPASQQPEPLEERQAYHSDIRELRPDVWSTHSPAAHGLDVERAMWLAGVSSRDFSEVVDIDLSPHLATPVDDIVALCRRTAEACERQAHGLSATLPPPNPYGRPPLPWHRTNARQARELYRAAQAWDAMARALLSNCWNA